MTDNDFQGARLRLARELKQMSQIQLARVLGVSPAAVSQFEGGISRPAAETIGRLGELLDVPAGFFQLPLNDTHEGFFRSLRKTTVSQRRQARAVAHIAHDLATGPFASTTLPGVTVPSLPVESLDVGQSIIEDAAIQVRKAWAMPRGPVPNVVELIECHGVTVIRLPLDTPDVDAFSLPFVDRPVIVLCADKNDRARSRFDAAHELGHLVLHGDQVWGMQEVERQAHGFAAAFLMPADDIYDELPSRADWPILFRLKTTWQVSLAALLMRGRTLGKLSEANYLTAVKYASARGWRRQEPVPLGPPEVPSQLRDLVQQAKDRMPLPSGVLSALLGAAA